MPAVRVTVSLVAPLAALFGLTLPVIVALYILRVRRPEVRVASTLHWRRAVLDRQAGVPWQRLRPSWLLLLQLLAAALLVLTLMRPVTVTSSALAGHTIVVIDISGSMQATDVTPSRFEEARSRARALVDRLGPDDRMTLIAMGPRPRVVADVTGDGARLRGALDELRSSNGDADLQGALALGQAAARPGTPTRLVLLSDGITEPLRAPLILPFDITDERIGVSGENLAITELSVSTTPGRREATVHIQNLGRDRRHTSVELRADGHLVDARPLDLEGGAGRDLAFTLPAAAQQVTAALTPTDLLALDDMASAVVTVPHTLHVILVTRGNLFLDRALRLRRDVALTTVDPDAYAVSKGADLYVFDGFLPPALPDRPVWVLAPPADPGLGTAGPVAPGRPRASNPDDPLLADVDLRDVHVARARMTSPAAGWRSVIEADTGPLLLVRDSEPRAVLTTFDIHESDLPLRTAFPLLVDRLSAFLLPASLPPRSHEPDDTVSVTPGSGATAVRVIGPDGAALSLPASGGGPGRCRHRRHRHLHGRGGPRRRHRARAVHRQRLRRHPVGDRAAGAAGPQRHGDRGVSRQWTAPPGDLAVGAGSGAAGAVLRVVGVPPCSLVSACRTPWGCLLCWRGWSPSPSGGFTRHRSAAAGRGLRSVCACSWSASAPWRSRAWSSNASPLPRPWWWWPTAAPAPRRRWPRSARPHWPSGITSGMTTASAWSPSAATRWSSNRRPPPRSSAISRPPRTPTTPTSSRGCGWRSR